MNHSKSNVYNVVIDGIEVGYDLITLIESNHKYIVILNEGKERWFSMGKFMQELQVPSKNIRIELLSKDEIPESEYRSIEDEVLESGGVYNTLYGYFSR